MEGIYCQALLNVSQDNFIREKKEETKLLTLVDWLHQQGVTHVTLESTGVYWKPIFNILEEDLSIVLVNPKKMSSPHLSILLRICQQQSLNQRSCLQISLT
jgi:transposase